MASRTLYPGNQGTTAMPVVPAYGKPSRKPATRELPQGFGTTSQAVPGMVHTGNYSTSGRPIYASSQEAALGYLNRNSGTVPYTAASQGVAAPGSSTAPTGLGQAPSSLQEFWDAIFGAQGSVPNLSLTNPGFTPRYSPQGQAVRRAQIPFTQFAPRARQYGGNPINIAQPIPPDPSTWVTKDQPQKFYPATGQQRPIPDFKKMPKKAYGTVY